ncbi:MAG: TnpV protein [Peptococcaceae bacterium]|nr:TnpV protein [Peptococcaceae bacterium]
MARFEFEYTEIDGLLYPNIEIDGKSELDSLGKYGRLRLSYLHEQKPEMYRELLFTGKLAEHCTTVEKAAFEMSEKIRAGFLNKNPMPGDDTMEHIHLSTQAQMIADEIVTSQIICI